jgi:dTDP-4-amino-4,6-dideoxygalactose transaminase
LYTVLLDIDNTKITRDQLLDALIKEKIGTGVHYTALHLHPYYQETYGYKRGDFPNAEFVSDRTLSLPISAKLTDEDVNDVIVALEKILA